jgi:hypothetical protein
MSRTAGPTNVVFDCMVFLQARQTRIVTLRPRLTCSTLEKSTSTVAHCGGFATLKGFDLSAQGCCTRLPWVMEPRWRGCGVVMATLKGLRPAVNGTLPRHASSLIIRATTPLGLGSIAIERSQGSRVRQPLGCETQSRWDCPDSSASAWVETLGPLICVSGTSVSSG